MIKVTRGAEPKVLRHNALRWRDELLRLKSDPGATTKQIRAAEGKYNHPEVKTQLKEMFADKCAYCEHKTGVGYYGDIEHFRPKTTHPELTFAWANLLYSCAVCNNTPHKSAQFPLDPAGNPLLVDPTDPTDDPALHFEFCYDPVTLYALVYGTDSRGSEVERVFDLNGARGRKELLRHRSQRVRQLQALAEFAKAGNAQALSLLRDACTDTAEYAAFARALCVDLGIPL